MGEVGATAVRPDRPALGSVPAEPSLAGRLIALGAFGLTAADLPDLSTSAWAPKAAVLMVLGAAGIPVLVVRASGRGLAVRSRSELWAARSAVAFVLVASVATLLALRPTLAVVGLYDQGTGLAFIVALAGCWALGTTLGAPERRVLSSALIAGAVVNAGVVVLQEFGLLAHVGLTGHDGVPDGLLGNQIFTGALLAASLVLIAPRCIAQPRRWWPAAALIGAGIALCGERLPGLVALVVISWTLWHIYRSGSDRPRNLGPAWTFAASALGGAVVGAVVAELKGSGGLAGHVAGSTGGETFGQRLSAWAAAVRAIGHHPLLGSGPGQFRTATSALFSLSYIREFNGLVFTDAHNFLLEFAATTGLIGLALLVGWVTLGAWRRRGPFLGFAIALAVVQLAEPLNVAVTPLTMLALGAAVLVSAPGTTMPSDQVSPAWLRRSSATLAVAACVPAVMLILGDVSLNRSDAASAVANTTASLSAAGTAERFLSPWPDPATQIATIHTYLYLAQGLSGPQASAAVLWSAVAAQRDPGNEQLWTSLAIAQVQAGRLGAAEGSARRAVSLSPWSPNTLDLLGNILEWQHRPAEARTWLSRSLAVDPEQRSVRSELDGRCIPPPLSARGFTHCQR